MKHSLHSQGKLNCKSQGLNADRLCCVHAGEASIITLSAPFIDDVAPKASVSLWFAILSIAPPLGVAVGMPLAIHPLEAGVQLVSECLWHRKHTK